MKSTKQNPNHKKLTWLPTKLGFTLLELLVVMAIIGILAGLGIGSFISAQKKSRDAKRKGDLKNVAKVLEAYLNDYGHYPLSSSEGFIIGCDSGSGLVACAWGGPFSVYKNGQTTTYMLKLPQDPNGFQYRYESDGTHYVLYARLENEKDKEIVSDLSVTCGSENCNYAITSSNYSL